MMIMRFLFCQSCNKKLLQVDVFNHIAIKCNRCKEINHFTQIPAPPQKAGGGGVNQPILNLKRFLSTIEYLF